jgi:tetrapyrrole methylase family protein/MazG family protein
VSGKITIVGLGPGGTHLLTRQAWELLNAAEKVVLRTRHHPILQDFPDTINFTSFDDFYEQEESFESVYGHIVAELRKMVMEGDVIYAVPGDPLVGEATVTALIDVAKEDNFPIEIVHGVSFIEPCLRLVGYDALDGITIVDGLELAGAHHPNFPPDMPALVGQIHSRLVASGVKLTLMNQYPVEHEVVLIHAAGTDQESISHQPLFEIDRNLTIDHLVALYVPPLPDESAFESFQETVAHLRAPDGCPWDREQTHSSLRGHILEEAYETLEALDVGNMLALREELGDLLLQIVLQAQIATESNEFTMADVIASIQEKIVRRHPHVFGNLDLEGTAEVLQNWEALKEDERRQGAKSGGLLSGVPKTLPALAQAAEIQSRVVRVGFDWPDITGVIEKVEEELSEVQMASDKDDRAAEIGDLFFAVVNYARWLDVDPESALREANVRFRHRFNQIEKAALRQDKRVSDLSLDEMNDLWEEAKGRSSSTKDRDS